MNRDRVATVSQLVKSAGGVDCHGVGYTSCRGHCLGTVAERVWRLSFLTRQYKAHRGGRFEKHGCGSARVGWLR